MQPQSLQRCKGMTSVGHSGSDPGTFHLKITSVAPSGRGGGVGGAIVSLSTQRQTMPRMGPKRTSLGWFKANEPRGWDNLHLGKKPDPRPPGCVAGMPVWRAHGGAPRGWGRGGGMVVGIAKGGSWLGRCQYLRCRCQSEGLLGHKTASPIHHGMTLLSIG